MRKLLLASLLLLPGQVLAGPPEGVSGRMAFDEVADGLRYYRKEQDPKKCINWLWRLAPTRDPRVAVALWDAACSGDDEQRQAAAGHLLCKYFLRGTQFHRVEDSGVQVFEGQKWWDANGADLRRRARELPR
jgi:hypothetical protein